MSAGDRPGLGLRRAAAPPPLAARLRARAVPLLFAAIALFFAWRAVVESPLGTPANPGPGAWPLALALVLLLAALWLMREGKAPDTGDAGTDEASAEGPGTWGGPLIILGACAFAALALVPLGYRLTTLLIVLFFLLGVERRGLVVSLLVALALSFGSFAVLSGLLRLRLPVGFLGV